MRASSPDRLPLALKAGWGFGSVGTITVLNVNALLLLFFMTTVLGLAPALAGGMLFAAKLIDAVMAPALGGISDRTVSRWGRRRPYLLAGALVSALGVAAVFQAPLGGGAVTMGWVAASLAVIAAGYTLFNVPYLAMPAELTASPPERTSLVSWRIAFVSLGGLVTGFAPKLAQDWGGGAEGYGRVGLILAAVVLAAMLVAFFASARAAAPASVPALARREPGGLKRYSVVTQNAPFMRVIAAKVCQLVGLASLTASALFLFKAALAQDEKTLFLYIAGTTAASVLSMPLWVRLGRSFDKRTLYIAGCIGFALVTISWLAAGPGEPRAMVLLRAGFAGLCSGGLLLMGQSLLPDTIDYDCRRSGVRREGVYAGFYSLVEKTSMAFGPLLVGVILQAFGFDPKAGPNAVQAEGAMTGVFLGAAVIPAALYALSVVPLLGSALSARRLAGEVDVELRGPAVRA